MKHITFAEKTLFVDDDTADCLVEYAAALGAAGTADTVRVRGIGGDGNEVEADFVLNPATNLMSESTNSDAGPPANDEAVAYMRRRIDMLRNGVPAHPAEGGSDHGDWDV